MSDGILLGYVTVNAESEALNPTQDRLVRERDTACMKRDILIFRYQKGLLV